MQGPQGPEGTQGPTGAQGPIGPAGPTGPEGQVGETGPSGLSAYEIWLSNGHSGSQQDFLTSLQGEIGPAGPQGPMGPTGSQGEIGPSGPQGMPGEPGLTGTAGESAFDIWIEAGNQGTEADFLTSLQGTNGEDGQPGETGVGIDSIWAESQQMIVLLDNEESYAIELPDATYVYETINNYQTHQYSGSFNESVLASLAKSGACIQNMDATELILYSGNTVFEEVCLPGMFFGERPGVRTFCLTQFSFDNSNLANSNWSCPSFIFHNGAPAPPYSGGLTAWSSSWNNCILNGAKFGNDNPLSTEGYSLGEINSNDWNYFGYSDRFQQCYFWQSTMERCEFKGVDLQECEFYSSSMRNCVFQNSNLRDVNFHSADLTGSRFSFVNLQGASFFNAVLAEVEFKDVYGCLEIVNLPTDCECIENDNGTHDISVGGNVFSQQQTECTPVHYQGRVYETVAIGNTCWFAENLSAEIFTDGTPLTDYKEANLSSFDFADEYHGPGFYRAGVIDGVDGDGEYWVSPFIGGEESVPGFQTLPSIIDSAEWANQHGVYYNMIAIDSELDLCPTGWHIPNEYDWTEAIESICGSSDGLSFPDDYNSIELAQETVNWSEDWSDFHTTFNNSCSVFAAYHEGTNGTGLRIRPSLSFRTQYPPENTENLPYPYPPQWFGGFVIKAVDNYENYISLWGPEWHHTYEIDWSSMFRQRGVHVRCVQDSE